jgi:hypothetical protein
MSASPLVSLSWMALLVLGGLVLLALWTMAMSRRHAAATNIRHCPQCDGTYPGHAAFCPNCGRKL